MITLSDIAKEVGCSPSTVSRALQGSPRIGIDTRNRVADVARALGYVGKSIAHSPRRSESNKVGLVIPTVHNSYNNHTTYVLHDTLEKEGYQIILCCHHNDPARDARILETLRKQQVSGIIHVPCTSEGAEGILGPDPIFPVVEMGLRSHTTWADSVHTDESSGVGLMIDHLVKLGHERIALISGNSHLYHVKVRASAFNDAIVRSRLKLRHCPIFNGPASVQWAHKTVSDCFNAKYPPTAILVANSPAMTGTLIALRDRGIKLPGEVSIAGLSNEDWYEAYQPALTAFELPFREMGIVAAQTLLSRLRPDMDSYGGAANVAFTGRLLQRASTSPIMVSTV